MKIISAILLIIALSAQTFSKWVVIFEYALNKDAISKNLCVNRMKPSSCCKGKCFLQKKLRADEEQQQPAGKAGRQDYSQDFFFNDATPFPLVLNVSDNRCEQIYLPGILQGYHPSQFQPPQFSPA